MTGALVHQRVPQNLRPGRTARAELRPRFHSAPIRECSPGKNDGLDDMQEQLREDETPKSIRYIPVHHDVGEYRSAMP